MKGAPLQDILESVKVAFPARAVVLARDSDDVGFDILGGKFSEGIDAI